MQLNLRKSKTHYCLVWHKIIVSWKVIATCRIHIGQDHTQSNMDNTFRHSKCRTTPHPIVCMRWITSERSIWLIASIACHSPIRADHLMNKILKIWVISCLHGWNIMASSTSPSTLGWLIGYVGSRLHSWSLIHEQKGSQNLCQCFIHVGATSPTILIFCAWINRLWLITSSS